MHPYVGVDVESGDVGAAPAGDGCLGNVAARAQAQHVTAAAWASGDQALHGGIRQLIEQGSLLFGGWPLPGENATQLAADGAGDTGDVLVGRRGQGMERQTPVGVSGVDTVEDEAVKVNVEAERGAEPLHDGQAAGLKTAPNPAPARPATQVAGHGHNERAQDRKRFASIPGIVSLRPSAE